MANEVGKVAFKLELTGQKEVQKEAQSTGVNIGAALSKGVKVAGREIAGGLKTFLSTASTAATVAIGTAASAVTALTTASIAGFKDYEQQAQSIETIYGDMSDTVIRNAQSAYKEAQISAQEYLEQTTKFSMRLLQGLEGDTERAAALSDMAIKDMADNANTFSTSIESVQNAYQGFARGEYRMLDNLRLGYGGTREEMERLLEDAEKLSGVSYDINNFADIVEAIHVIQESQGIAGTAARESQETIQGSINATKAAFQNFITGLADPNANIDELANNLVDSVTSLSENLIPAIGRIITRIAPALAKLGGSIITNLAKAIIPLAPVLLKAIMDVATMLLKDATELLPLIADGLVQLLYDLVNYLPTFLPVLFEFTFKLFEEIARILPDLVYLLVDGIMQIVDMLLQPENVQRLITGSLQLLSAIITAIPLFISALAKHLPTIIESIVEFLTDPQTLLQITIAFLQCLEALVAAVPMIIDSLGEAFKKLFGDIWDRLKTTFEEFAGNFGTAIGGFFIKAVNKVLDFIEGFINKPIETINLAIDALNNIPGVDLDHLGRITLPRIPAMAQGGLVNSATTALIGEDGKEAVIPLERNQDNWAGLLAHKLAEEFEQQENAGSPINVYLNATINNDMDAEELCNKLTTALRRAA